jgi:exodeoxyribonuclease VII small subunit
METKKTKAATFEEKEKRLDEIIGKLENEKTLTLQDTAALYAEGKKLIGELNDELKGLKDLVTHEIVADK